MTSHEVSLLMTDAEERIPRAVDRLMALYKLHDAQIGDFIGVGQRQMNDRRRGKTRFTIAEMVGLAYLFDLDLSDFLLDEHELVRKVVNRDGGLDTPWRRLPMAHQRDDEGRAALTRRYAPSAGRAQRRPGADGPWPALPAVRAA